MSKHSFKIKSSRKANSLFDEAVAKKPSISRSTATYNRWGVTSYSPANAGQQHNLDNDLSSTTTNSTRDDAPQAGEDIFSFGSEASEDDDMHSPPSRVTTAVSTKGYKSYSNTGRHSLKRNGENLGAIDVPPSTVAVVAKSRRLDYDPFAESPEPLDTIDLDDTLTQEPVSDSQSSTSSSISDSASGGRHSACSQLNSDLDFDASTSRTPSPCPLSSSGANNHTSSSTASNEAAPGGKPPLRCTIRINNAAKLISERLKVMDCTPSAASAAPAAKNTQTQPPPIVRRILSAPIKVVQSLV